MYEIIMIWKIYLVVLLLLTIEQQKLFFCNGFVPYYYDSSSNTKTFMQRRVPTRLILSSPDNTIISSTNNNNNENNNQTLIINGNNNNENNNNKRGTIRNRRKPAFPKSTYPLIKDENDIQHIFISFIDQSIFKKYSQTVRLVEPRTYAKPDQFLKENYYKQPTIEDVAEPQSLYSRWANIFAWNGLPARTIVGTMSYIVFPYIIQFLQMSTRNVNHDDLITLVNTFLPSISIVLGTYFSLTITILYDRFTKMQEIVNIEAGLLALTCNNIIHLFSDTNPTAAIDGAQCIADQVRTMVFDSRGKETMGIIYNDPYTRILQLLKIHESELNNNNTSIQRMTNIQNNVNELFKLRSKRMSFESLALTPTHYDVMTFLCSLLLLGFALGTVATTTTDNELARILFASLVVCYTIFYEMSFDLNRPFHGIYQLRRSGAAMHFLQIKQLICNHPITKNYVNFDEIIDEEEINLDCDPTCQERKAKIWYN